MLGLGQARERGPAAGRGARTAAQSMPGRAASWSRSPVRYSGTLHASRRSHGPRPHLAGVRIFERVR